MKQAGARAGLLGLLVLAIVLAGGPAAAQAGDRAPVLLRKTLLLTPARDVVENRQQLAVFDLRVADQVFDDPRRQVVLGIPQTVDEHGEELPVALPLLRLAAVIADQGVERTDLPGTGGPGLLELLELGSGIFAHAGDPRAAQQADALLRRQRAGIPGRGSRSRNGQK